MLAGDIPDLSPDETANVEDFLSHHGIKGMHWGVRKERDSSGSSNGSTDHSKAKKALAIGGTVAGVALIAAGTIYAAKHGYISTSSIGSSSEKLGKDYIEKTVKASRDEPTGVIHVAGAKYLADAVHRRGGLDDLYEELQSAGLANQYGHADLQPGQMRRYGKNLEKVALSFNDPDGRHDASGRPIIRNVVLPAQHARDVTNFEEAKNKAISLTRDDYEKFWNYGLSRTASEREARSLGLMDLSE